MMAPVRPDPVDLARRLRRTVIETHTRAGGHLGGSLSTVEILAALFSGPFDWERGDRFVLSKGHAGMAYYSLLAELERIPHEVLDVFAMDGSPIETHPSEHALDDIHVSTGSLGQGLSVGTGLALGGLMRNSTARTVVLLGDGETNEGQVWEAARAAAHLGLGNLLAVVDVNGLQQDGPMDEIMPVVDLPVAWAAMGWQVEEVDGHDLSALGRTMASLSETLGTAPKLIWAETVKAKGVEFLEGSTESHHPPPLSPEDMLLLRLELDRV